MVDGNQVVQLPHNTPKQIYLVGLLCPAPDGPAHFVPSRLSVGRYGLRRIYLENCGCMLLFIELSEAFPVDGFFNFSEVKRDVVQQTFDGYADASVIERAMMVGTELAVLVEAYILTPSLEPKLVGCELGAKISGVGVEGSVHLDPVDDFQTGAEDASQAHDVDLEAIGFHFLGELGLSL
jgi:hypothetical protein